VRVEEIDLREQDRLPQLLEGRDLVFNLAGHTSHIDSMNAPQTDLQLNCRAQLALLEACRRLAPAPTIVFAGTRQVYGRPQYLPVDESHPIEPVDVNGIHKAAAERYHLLYGHVYGIPVVVLRLTNTYGPGMRVRDARQTFLGVWLRALVHGEEFEIWGDGSQLRDFTYVDDAVSAFSAGCGRPARLREGAEPGR
jgi:UDP-glucose 4-epimerase